VLVCPLFSPESKNAIALRLVHEVIGANRPSGVATTHVEIGPVAGVKSDWADFWRARASAGAV